MRGGLLIAIVSALAIALVVSTAMSPSRSGRWLWLRWRESGTNRPDSQYQWIDNLIGGWKGCG